MYPVFGLNRGSASHLLLPISCQKIGVLRMLSVLPLHGVASMSPSFQQWLITGIRPWPYFADQVPVLLRQVPSGWTALASFFITMKPISTMAIQSQKIASEIAFLLRFLSKVDRAWSMTISHYHHSDGALFTLPAMHPCFSLLCRTVSPLVMRLLKMGRADSKHSYVTGSCVGAVSTSGGVSEFPIK